MSEEHPNYIIGPDDNDDLIYSGPVETFFICISCNSAVRTEISYGWDISEHIPMKSLDTSHICITRCARCYTAILTRDSRGHVRAIVPVGHPRIRPLALGSRSEYQEVLAMCTRTPELICWLDNGTELVAYVPIRMIEKHHFNDTDVICVRSDSNMVGKIDMNFFVISRYL